MNKGIVTRLAVILVLTGNAKAVVKDHTHPHPGPVASNLERHVLPQDILKKLDISFLMELEGFAARVGDTSEGDLTLATVELTVDAEVVNGVLGHLGLLWEEDDTEGSNLDEGYVTFGATETIPFYATGGKMYLPFGNFESVFISDPLTLEMAEINESAALLGYGNDWIDLNAGVFSGELEEDPEDNTIESGFASIAFMPGEAVVFGAYWLSDLLYTAGFEDFANNAILAGYGYESTGGAGIFLNAQIGSVALNAEYMTALEKLDPVAGGLLSSTYNLEASMPIFEKLSAGIKVEGSDDFYSDFVGGDPEGKFADWQVGLVVSYEFNNNVTLSGEYLHADGLGGGESGDLVTMQIALEL